MTEFPFPFNVIAWIAVTAALLAMILAVGAMLDGMTFLIGWLHDRRDARRRNPKG